MNRKNTAKNTENSDRKVYTVEFTVPGEDWIPCPSQAYFDNPGLGVTLGIMGVADALAHFDSREEAQKFIDGPLTESWKKSIRDGESFADVATARIVEVEFKGSMFDPEAVPAEEEDVEEEPIIA